MRISGMEHRRRPARASVMAVARPMPGTGRAGMNRAGMNLAGTGFAVMPIIALLMAAWCSASTVLAAPSYTLTDLGTLEGDSVAYAVNELGQVVGISKPNSYSSRAWVWQPGTGLAELDGLRGDQTFAYDINDVGQIVGGGETTDFGLHALLWDGPGSPSPTDLNPSPDHFSSATAINNAGTAVLQAQRTTDFGSSVMLWNEGTGLVDYGRLGGTDAQGWDINASNDVALYWTSRGMPVHAMQWHPDDGLWFTSNDIPSADEGDNFLQSGNSHSVNASGSMAGAYFVAGTPGGWRAFRWAAAPGRLARDYPQGLTTELATLGAESIAWAINDGNDVVGFSNPVVDSRDEEGFRATLWDFVPIFEDGQQVGSVTTLYDLNDLLVGDASIGWTLLGAQDINNAGQIVGYGRAPDGQMRAVLLTPALVPEPATVGLLTMAMGLALGRRRTRRLENKPTTRD